MSKIKKQDLINELQRIHAEDTNTTTTNQQFLAMNNLGINQEHIIEHFGSWLVLKRSAGILPTGNAYKISRKIAKDAETEIFKDYYESEVLPFCNKPLSKAERNKQGLAVIMVCSDIHDIESDAFTVEVFLDVCKRKQPDIIVINGDLFDLYEFSSFHKNPKDFNIKKRFDWVDRFLNNLRTACPHAQIDFLLGNHEQRLITHLAKQSPQTRILMSDVLNLTFADIFCVKKYNINVISKFDLGSFTERELKGQLSKNYKIYYNTWVACHEPDKALMNMNGTNGHHHTGFITSNAYVNPESGESKPVTWMQTPGFHKKDAEYLKNMCKWQCGFGEVHVFIESKTCNQYIHFTNEQGVVVDGIYYKRK